MVDFYFLLSASCFARERNSLSSRVTQVFQRCSEMSPRPLQSVHLSGSWPWHVGQTANGFAVLTSYHPWSKCDNAEEKFTSAKSRSLFSWAARSAPFTRLTALSRVKGALRSAQENKDKLFAEVNFSSALSQLDQAWTDIKTAKPFAVCPTCQGQMPDKCMLCRGRGLISEHRWKTCVTREDKEFRFKAKGKR